MELRKPGYLNFLHTPSNKIRRQGANSRIGLILTLHFNDQQMNLKKSMCLYKLSTTCFIIQEKNSENPDLLNEQDWTRTKL